MTRVLKTLAESVKTYFKEYFAGMDPQNHRPCYTLPYVHLLRIKRIKAESTTFLPLNSVFQSKLNGQIFNHLRNVPTFRYWHRFSREFTTGADSAKIIIWLKVGGCNRHLTQLLQFLLPRWVEHLLHRFVMKDYLANGKFSKKVPRRQKNITFFHVAYVAIP